MTKIGDKTATAVSATITGQPVQVAPLPEKLWSESGVTQFTASGAVVNGLLTLVTVGAGKTGFLTSIYLENLNTAAVQATCSLQLATSTPTVYLAWAITMPAGTNQRITLSFPVPVKMAAGDIVRLVSSALLVQASGAVTGYTL